MHWQNDIMYVSVPGVLGTGVCTNREIVNRNSFVPFILANRPCKHFSNRHSNSELFLMGRGRNIKEGAIVTAANLQYPWAARLGITPGGGD